MRQLFEELKAAWHHLSFYGKFEQVIALFLTLLISIIIIVAVAGLARDILPLLTMDAASPSGHALLQSIFGHIMTVLIALEFKHSILRADAREGSIIQVKTVLLIALLVMARKFIILDAEAISANTVFALATVVIALSVSYWLIRERDDRLLRQHQPERRQQPQSS